MSKFEKVHGISRRASLATLAAVVAAPLMMAAGQAAAEMKEVKIVLIAPMSGPWARQGQLMKLGADMAIDDINKAGGVKSLGGAKFKLIVADAGDNAEKAKQAAQLMLSRHPDAIGGTGSWLSSFTLAVTELTERAKMPWLTLSYSDKITERGFRYVFQTSPTGGAQSRGSLPTIVALMKKYTGKAPKTAGIVMDNTAAPVSYAKALRGGALNKAGLKLVVDQTFTPPLSDASPIIQKVRSARPQLLFLLASNVPDDKLLVEKLAEFGLGRGRIPMVANGAHMAVPELLKVIADPTLLNGMMVVTANWGSKGQEELIARFEKRTGEPWLTQDSISTYGDMMVFKWALEKTGKLDRVAVAEAIRTMDVTDGPAAYYPGGRLHFEKNGRRAGAPLVIVQWQNGKPQTIYPEGSATAKPIWVKR